MRPYCFILIGHYQNAYMQVLYNIGQGSCWHCKIKLVSVCVLCICLVSFLNLFCGILFIYFVTGRLSFWIGVMEWFFSRDKWVLLNYFRTCAGYVSGTSTCWVHMGSYAKLNIVIEYFWSILTKHCNELMSLNTSSYSQQSGFASKVFGLLLNETNYFIPSNFVSL